MSNQKEHHDIARAIREGFSCLARAIDGLRPEFSKPKGHFDISIGLVAQKKENQMVNVTITNSQKVPITLTPRKADKPDGSPGGPANLDGPAKWSVVDGDATITDVSTDGLSATLVSGDLPGVSNILVDADADLGVGVEDLQEVITLTVTGDNAKNLGITVGTPQDK